MKTCSFMTLGCKVNQYESQAIRENFLRCGYKEAAQGEKADIFIINTCTVTEVSDRKSRQLIRDAIKLNPEATVIVTGCYAEKNADEISEIKNVDFIVSNSRKHEIAAIIQKFDRDKTRRLRNERLLSDDKESDRFLPLSISYFKNHTRVFIKVQDGCDNFCSFCKVPLVRGRTRSRNLNDILDEAQRLIEKGFKEIVLTGICLGAYGKDSGITRGIVGVIEELEKIEGAFRIRLSSIEPLYVSEYLIEKMAYSDKLCKHLHIPLQSGDDEILKSMNRKYNSEQYISLVDKIKKKIPEVSITTDVLVGFPGEKDINFENTLKTVEKISPSRIHIFPYSIRKETTAAGLFTDMAKPKIVKERIGKLRKLALKLSFEYRKRFLDKNVVILIEFCRERQFLTGYSDTYIKCYLEGPDALMNKLVPVKITEVSGNFTKGTVINDKKY